MRVKYHVSCFKFNPVALLSDCLIEMRQSPHDYIWLDLNTAFKLLPTHSTACVYFETALFTCVSCKWKLVCSHGNEGLTSFLGLQLSRWSASLSCLILSPDLLEGWKATKQRSFFLHLTVLLHPHRHHWLLRLILMYLWRIMKVTESLCSLLFFSNISMNVCSFLWNLYAWRSAWAQQWLHKEHINIDRGASHILDKLPERFSWEGLSQTTPLALDTWSPAGFTPVRWGSCSGACFSGGP